MQDHRYAVAGPCTQESSHQLRHKVLLARGDNAHGGKTNVQDEAFLRLDAIERQSLHLGVQPWQQGWQHRLLKLDAPHLAVVCHVLGDQVPGLCMPRQQGINETAFSWNQLIRESRRARVTLEAWRPVHAHANERQ